MKIEVSTGQLVSLRLTEYADDPEDILRVFVLDQKREFEIVLDRVGVLDLLRGRNVHARIGYVESVSDEE